MLILVIDKKDVNSIEISKFQPMRDINFHLLNTCILIDISQPK